MVENQYEVGDLVTLTARFQDPVTLAYVVPEVVRCEIKDPDGTVTTPDPTYEAELATVDGTVGPGYLVEFLITLPGRHYYQFAAVGQKVKRGRFMAEQPAFVS